MSNPKWLIEPKMMSQS